MPVPRQSYRDPRRDGFLDGAEYSLFKTMTLRNDDPTLCQEAILFGHARHAIRHEFEKSFQYDPFTIRPCETLLERGEIW